MSEYFDGTEHFAHYNSFSVEFEDFTWVEAEEVPRRPGFEVAVGEAALTFGPDDPSEWSQPNNTAKRKTKSQIGGNEYRGDDNLRLPEHIPVDETAVELERYPNNGIRKNYQTKIQVLFDVEAHNNMQLWGILADSGLRKFIEDFGATIDNHPLPGYLPSVRLENLELNAYGDLYSAVFEIVEEIQESLSKSTSATIPEAVEVLRNHILSRTAAREIIDMLWLDQPELLEALKPFMKDEPSERVITSRPAHFFPEG